MSNEIEIYNTIKSHMRNQTPWPFDAVDLMLLSAAGIRSLPTDAGTETCLGLSHTSAGSHMPPHALPPSLPPLARSVSSHTHVQSNGSFMDSLRGQEKRFHVKFIKQLECDYVNEPRLAATDARGLDLRVSRSLTRFRSVAFIKP